MNLFYSLPDDVMHIIHKKVYSMEVLRQIRREGDFAYCFGKKRVDFCPDDKQCEIVYNVLESIGPDAWEYVKERAWFHDDSNKQDPMYQRILEELRSKNDFDVYHPHEKLFMLGLVNMHILAKSGWQKYVELMRPIPVV
jgi:hypothetical protein